MILDAFILAGAVTALFFVAAHRRDRNPKALAKRLRNMGGL